MVDLKSVPTSDTSKGDDVSYLWVCSQRRRKAEGRKARVSLRSIRKGEGDPMFVPWGDIVETPIGLLKRLFDRS
jgi:hypothetical protein